MRNYAKSILMSILIVSSSFSAFGASSTHKIEGQITDLEVSYNGDQFLWFTVNGESPSFCNGGKIKAVPSLLTAYVLSMHAQNKNVWVIIHNSSCTAASISETPQSNY